MWPKHKCISICGTSSVHLGLINMCTYNFFVVDQSSPFILFNVDKIVIDIVDNAICHLSISL